jgi:phosphatidate cytidylyltransferase
VLLQRVITAIILVAGLLLLAVASTPFVFALVAALIVLLAAMEWTRFIGLQTLSSRVSYCVSLAVMLGGAFILIGATPDATTLETLRVLTLILFGCLFWGFAAWLMTGYPDNAILWNDESHIALMGIFVLLPTWCAVVQLKYLDTSGALLLATVATVSVADIGAYFSGRAWGRKKLAPDLSPGKSWAGFWGGVLSSVGLCLLLLAIAVAAGVSVSPLQALLLVAGAALVSASGVVGDLFESMLKRNRKLKDSGGLLPGHGGILDRLDSLTAAAPVAVLWLLLVNQLGSGS